MTLSATPPAFAANLARRWLAGDPLQALANFTWMSNVSVGASYCRFAHDDESTCLAQHLSLPFTAISVEGEDPDVVRRLTAELLPPGQHAFTLAPARIAALLRQAASILDARPEWQMFLRAGVDNLDPGSARRLTPADLPAMQELAQTGEAMVFSPESIARGAFFGVYRGQELAAMGGVQTELPGLSEIGSIVTHPACRRQSYATQVVAALIHHLHARDQHVFLCLFQTNTAARALYEKMGFEIANELTLLCWQQA